jgi:FixJ family two-component response regulator
LAAFIQCANKYAHGFLIKPGINERLLDAVILPSTDRMDTRAKLEDNSRQLKKLMDNLPGVAYRCLMIIIGPWNLSALAAMN